MNCDNCRYGGMCIRQSVMGNLDFSECEIHEEYKERPHGTWVDVPKYKGFYVCSKCLERFNGDFERFDHWEMKKDNFCSVCGSDNRNEGSEYENTQKHYGFRKKY